MRTNVKTPRPRTHEGAPARRLTAEQELRRSVLACLLFEDGFYEDGETIAQRILDLGERCHPETVSALAVEARERFHLRHAPLLLTVALQRALHAHSQADSTLVADTLARVLQRADEPGEFVALWWKLNGRRMLPRQVKRGLARALTRFDAYQLAKYDRASAALRQRDVIRLVHPRPRDAEQAERWRQAVAGELPSPDTWEVNLSAGADKRETFERLLREERLGYLALLRNLRNMQAAGVDSTLIRGAIRARRGARRVLPFRYVAAARHAPQFEPDLDAALQESIAEMPRLPGRTVVLVDVSLSMNHPLSARSDLTRAHAAAALAAVVPAEELRVFSFSERIQEVPPRRGLAGVDAVLSSQPHRTTYLGKAVQEANRIGYDRLIVVTDEQSHDPVPNPIGRGYMINVASDRNGVGYGPWLHVDGFSEACLRYIGAIESEVGLIDGDETGAA